MHHSFRSFSIGLAVYLVLGLYKEDYLHTCVFVTVQLCGKRGGGVKRPQTDLPHQVDSCSYSNWQSLVILQWFCNQRLRWRFCVVTLLFWIFVGTMAFVIGLSQIYSFLSLLKMYYIMFYNCLNFFADQIAIHFQIINFPKWSEIQSYIQHICLFLRHICEKLLRILRLLSKNTCTHKSRIFVVNWKSKRNF